MNGITARFLRLGVALSGLAVLGWVLTGQASEPVREGMPMDWSHRHVIFSEPSTFEQIAQVTNDPRYWQQWYRNHVARALATDSVAPGDAGAVDPALRPTEAGRLVTEASSAGAWSESMGSGATGGAGNYPAKYSAHITTASCSDFVVFNTGLQGSATQATIVAYNNLYSGGCTAPVPQTYWAYNTGGTVVTSPAFSQDGTQVAFVQQNAGLEGVLILLKWAPSTGTVGHPVVLGAVSHNAYRNCTAPCMTSIFLKDGSGTDIDDTTSSAFPDYNHDILWVGGAFGWLHKITGAFLGTPGEVILGGYPVQVNTGNSLSSPVWDRTSGNVYVGDYGGFFYQVTTASPPVVTASGQIDHGTGIVAGPVIDSTKDKIYIFSSSDGSTACPVAAPTLPCSAVFEFAPGFAAGSKGAEAVVGTSQAAPPNPSAMYEGAFDSTYEASGTATGNFYVCGNTGGVPTLYQIPIVAGVMQTPVAGPARASATTGCSPVTDISNPNGAAGIAEWIFASAQASGLGNSCAVGTGGCVMNFNVQPWLPSHSYLVGQFVLDTNANVQVCRVAGTSRTAAQGHPAWNATINGNTGDNTAKWTNQGPNQASHPAWQASHAYALGSEILDSNGNVEWASNAGTSKAGSNPVWNTAIAGNTADNTGANKITWKNVGTPATFSVAAAGGTGGIIIDNNVGTGFLAGASQVYFSTLTNQTCTTSATTGGCAVQASQSGLQ
jgi:hypothetical protein